MPGSGHRAVISSPEGAGNAEGHCLKGIAFIESEVFFMGKYFGTDGVRGVAGADLTCELIPLSVAVWLRSASLR